VLSDPVVCNCCWGAICLSGNTGVIGVEFCGRAGKGKFVDSAWWRVLRRAYAVYDRCRDFICACDVEAIKDGSQEGKDGGSGWSGVRGCGEDSGGRDAGSGLEDSDVEGEGACKDILQAVSRGGDVSVEWSESAGPGGRESGKDGD